MSKIKNTKEVDKLLNIIDFKIRTTEGLTRSGLSEKLGKSKSYISELLSKNIELSLELFTAITKELNLSPYNEIEDFQNKESPFVITKYSELGRLTPRKRYGDLYDPNIKYFSMLDRADSGFKSITDFEIIISEFEAGTESEVHFHQGEEFCYVLKGDLRLEIMSDSSNKKNGLKMDEHKLNTDEEFKVAWYKAWMPHSYKAVESEAQTLFIIKDPRGDAGFYYDSSDNENITDINRTSIGNELVQVINEKNRHKFNVTSIRTGFGINLQQARQRANIKLDTLSKLMNLSKSYLSRLERNEVNPSLNLIFKLADHLDVNPNKFFSHYKYPAYIHPEEDFDKNIRSGKYKEKERDIVPADFFVDRSLDVKIIEFGKELSENNIEMTECDRDIALFVIEGAIEFVYYKDESEKILADELLKKWSTIYLKAKNRHYFKSVNGNAKALFISLINNENKKPNENMEN